MNIIEESVNLLERQVQGTGCEDGTVVLRVDPDGKKCQFEYGVCMVATFGGRSAVFVTEEPTRATTKVSFMFGASLEKPGTRAAASAIINAVTGFLCTNRVLKACPPGCHEPCIRELKSRINGRRTFMIGFTSRLETELRPVIVSNIGDAELILVNADGISSDNGLRQISAKNPGQELMFIGPSLSGVAQLQKIHHWCPYGMS